MNFKTVTLGIVLGILLLTTVIEAKSAALIVKDRNDLSQQHEKSVFEALQEMGFNITLVDKTSNVTYTDFDLLVIAGRPGNVPTQEKLDDFIATLPVNKMPTIAIEPAFVDRWGWVKYGGASTLFSSKIQRIFITDNNISITSNFTTGEEVVVHEIKGGNIVDVRKDLTRLRIIAGVEKEGTHGIIAVADANTTLFNNQTTSNRVVFFGITDTELWSDEAESLFRKSVEWATALSDETLEGKDNGTPPKGEANITTVQQGGGWGGNPLPVLEIQLPEGEIEVIELPEKIELEVGKPTTVNFRIHNGLNANLTDVKFAIIDYIPTTWYTIVPEKIDLIEEGETKDVTITFNIPQNAEIYTYSLTLRVITHSKFGAFPYFQKFNILLMEPIETTTTTLPSTTTTSSPEKPRTGLTGLFVALVSKPLWLTVFLVLIGMIFLVWKFYPHD